MSLSYQDCGVSVGRNDTWVETLKKNGVTDGGFASLFEEGDDVWVSSTDGVGSKLILVLENHLPNHLFTLGQDLVAMVVNDIITTGALPLFLLDYLAVHKIGDLDLSELILGVKAACEQCGCSLIGGETAELPDMIQRGVFDIAGFGVGKVAKSELWCSDRVQEGDMILGIESSGPHANGFSLIRKIHDQNPFSRDELYDLLRPTHLYAPLVKRLKETFSSVIKVGANITGGGLLGNLTRVIPPYLTSDLDIPTLPPLFITIQEKGKLEEDELRTVLNCGIGFALIVHPDYHQEIKEVCNLFFPNHLLGVVVQKD